MPLSRRVVAMLAALFLCVPAAAFAQTDTIPQTGAGVSTQPPVELGGSTEEPQIATPVPPVAPARPAAPAGSELPNTGSDPRLLFLAGLALVLLGVGLRLRTADADLY